MSEGQLFDKKFIKEEISNRGFVGSLSTVENAAAAYIDMAKKSPIGRELLQGVVLGRGGLSRQAYEDLSVDAVAYSIYKYVAFKGFPMLRVSDLYEKKETHGVAKEFCIPRENLLKKLRTLNTESNRVLIAELNMGLEHITTREDLTPVRMLEQKVLKKGLDII